MNMESKPFIAQTGIHVVQLPDQVSSAIDSFVDEFVASSNKDIIRYAQRLDADTHTAFINSTKRWQGADLWLILGGSLETELSIATPRVTIGAFSDAPDTLVFIPDIIVTRTNGQFMLPPDTPDWVEIENLQVPVSDLTRLIGVESSSANNIFLMLMSVCSVAWRIAEEISPSKANVLVA